MGYVNHPGFLGLSVDVPSPRNRQNAPVERLYATVEKTEQGVLLPPSKGV
jgi:hypothetical protein